MIILISMGNTSFSSACISLTVYGEPQKTINIRDVHRMRLGSKKVCNLHIKKT